MTTAAIPRPALVVQIAAAPTCLSASLRLLLRRALALRAQSAARHLPAVRLLKARPSMTVPIRLIIALGAVCAVAASPARAEEPPPRPPIPACDAPNGAESVARQYLTMQMKSFEPGVLQVGPVKDLGVFPPSENDNRYANKQMFIHSVRYCEAAITLPDGTVDQTYWAIPLTFNIKSWIAQSIYCSLKHDVLQTKCARYRPKGATLG